MIKIDGYPIDIAITESYSFESTTTPFPVEQGADITDHVRLSPLKIEVECVVSDTPIGRIASDASRLNLDAEGGPAGADAFQRLVAIRDARKPVPYEGRRGRFENMVLSFQVPDDIETTGGLRFTASLEQVQIVQNRRVTIKTVASVPRGKPKVNKGAIATIDRGTAIATLVFTLRGGKWIGTPSTVKTQPYWVTNPNKQLVLTEPNGDQRFKAENGAYADGSVNNSNKYIPFKKPFPTGMALEPVTSDGTPIPQTTDYVSPLEQRIGPKPVESWQDAWTTGYTKGVFGSGQ